MKASNDPIRQVQAVLMVHGKLYTGVNEMWDVAKNHPIWNNRPAVRILVTHAEVNAVRAALADGINDFSKASLYVSLHPCEQCLNLCKALGIDNIQYAEDYIPSEVK